ncbi:MAG: glycosyltransferase 87 family protein [Lachnospiraceae bacterium]|nr:glycosyltransferase 87 family protein [Lachnospiraceae bacterium]
MCTSIQRGNVVILVALLLALAWLWMDSDSRIRQELALLFIAAAAGFKLYPALVGVVYLKRKEWKKAFRLVLYGVIVVFVPFVFFGGYKGMLSLIHTLTGFAVDINADKTNTVCGMAKWLGLKLNMADSVANTFGMIVDYLFFIVSLLCFFLSKRKWQEALFLSGILVSFLPSNWEYTLVYYLPAFFLFMKKYDGEIKQNGIRKNLWLIFHAVSFGMIFSVNFFMLYYRYGLISGVFTVTYLLIGVNMFSVLWEFVKSKAP